jgi:hypothetical protein
VWLAEPYRATRDVDLLASGAADEDVIRALLTEVCAVPCPEDGLRFDLSELTIEPIRAEEEYSGKRARFRAFLGKTRIALQLDIGVGDAVVPPPEDVTYPTLLRDLPAPWVRAYPREVTVAEKFEAMVKLDTRNSRMKDFHDVWALAGAFFFEGARLRSAVAACFERRGTVWPTGAPGVLTSAFYESDELAERWQRYVIGGDVLVAPPRQFPDVGERVMQFLGPVRASIVGEQPFESQWQPGGPWR